jgi:hypothetical protein
MLLPRLDLVNLLNRLQIHRIDSQAIKGVCRQRNHVALPETRDDVLNTFGLWFVGMDPQDFRGQIFYLGSLISLGGRDPNRTLRQAVFEPLPSSVLYRFFASKARVSQDATIA